jgi:hypothetical protein
MTMSADELTTISGSFIARERETTAEVSPSADKEIGKLILNKNIPETFLMSKEVDTMHDLNNINIPPTVSPIDGKKELKNQTIPLKKQEKLENKLQGLQITNKTRRTDLPRTQIDTFSDTNYTVDKPVDGGRNDLADKHKEQISAINYQSKKDKQKMTDIKSELHNISKLYPCDITSSPNTGSSIIHIPDTNNPVNNKQVSQQRIHSHTVTTEKNKLKPKQVKFLVFNIFQNHTIK